MTIGYKNSDWSLRFKASANKLSFFKNGTNCFGKLLREAGHNLDPTPPAKIMGVMFGIVNSWK